MTPDPAAPKRFYDAVVPGWDIDIGERIPGDQDYRMIRRADGGNAGGVLTLTDEMRAGGARPIWLGYLHVEDVDAKVAADQGRWRPGDDAGRGTSPASAGWRWSPTRKALPST